MSDNGRARLSLKLCRGATRYLSQGRTLGRRGPGGGPDPDGPPVILAPDDRDPTAHEAMEVEPVVHVDVRPGARIPPGYRLVECLGRGGYGEVWRAEAEGGFHVALKLVPLGDDAERIETRSLEVIRDLRHPHLIAVFGAWRAGSHLIIAMELADRTLYARLTEARAAGHDGIPGAELIEYMEDAARALDFLNGGQNGGGGPGALGIQHRDVKPQNLLLVGGSVKLGDFGLARLLDHSITGHTGSMTPSYAAPEFFRLETSTRSDQYSLAVTYCQLRGGRVPFVGGPAAVMAGHLGGRPDLSMLPDRERAAVARALEKEPNDRWPSCRAFVRALESATMAEVPASPTIRTHPAAVPEPASVAEASGDPSPDERPGHTRRAWAEAARPDYMPDGTSIDRAAHRGPSSERRDAPEETAPTFRQPEAERPTIDGERATDPTPESAMATSVDRQSQGAERRILPLAVDVAMSPTGGRNPRRPGRRWTVIAMAIVLLASVFVAVHPRRVAAPLPAAGLSPVFDPATRASALDRRESLPAREKRDETITVRRESVPLKPVSAIAHSNLGHALLGQGKLPEATAEFRAAVALQPDLAAAHFGLGKALKRQGKPDEAIAEFRQTIRLVPDYPHAHSYLGSALRDQRKLPEAIAAYRQDIRENPGVAITHANLAAILQDSGSLDEAVAEYHEAVRLEPKLAEVHAFLASALSAQGKPDLAILEYREALRLKPGLASARRALAAALGGRGDLEEAIVEYREAIRLEPRNAEAHNGLGVILYRQGKRDRAIVEFQEATRLNPDLAVARSNLGNALRTQVR
jgi:tetratricopeptide (TPR) repeat protein/serine/threonine protein kinase